MKKTFGTIMIVVVFLYIAAYMVLTLFGEYKLTGSGALGLPGKYVWNPMMLEWSRDKTLSGDTEMTANIGGYIFSPAIMLDRTVWHRDKGLLEKVKDSVKEGLE